MHMTPPASQLPRLMNDLMAWLAKTDAHPFIASCAFHYELEFIHPFSDGNGRIGRLWQTLILSQWQPMLAYLPIETVIKTQQRQYYQTLSEADQAGDCSSFIQFMLDAIHVTLQQAIAVSVSTVPLLATKTSADPSQQILELLRQHPEYSLSQVATHIGKGLSTVERLVRGLRQAGAVRYVGSRKTGYWEVIQ